MERHNRVPAQTVRLSQCDNDCGNRNSFGILQVCSTLTLIYKLSKPRVRPKCRLAVVNIQTACHVAAVVMFYRNSVAHALLAQ
jgi:hypothetical protein